MLGDGAHSSDAVDVDSDCEIDTTPWEVHVQASEERRRREEEHREALFLSGPTPKWTALPDPAWDIIIAHLDAYNGPSGAADFYYAFLGTGHAGNLRNWLEDGALRLGGNESVVIAARGDVDIYVERSDEVRQLCEAAGVGRLHLGSHFRADTLLRRPRFQELHAHKLLRLDCALGDFSLLRHLPLLHTLGLQQLRRDQPFGWPAVALAPADLAPLESLTRLTELQLKGYMEVPLRAVSLPGLKMLRVTTGMMDGEVQDAFRYSLPRGCRLRALEVRGPVENAVDNELESVPYDTPLDLAAAAERCESITLHCRSLVLEDPGGALDGVPPQLHVVEALRRGTAWTRLDCSMQQMHVLNNQSELEPIDLAETLREVRAALGGSEVEVHPTYLQVTRTPLKV